MFVIPLVESRKNIKIKIKYKSILACVFQTCSKTNKTRDKTDVCVFYYGGHTETSFKCNPTPFFKKQKLKLYKKRSGHFV
jgi:hypothetical protein